jgi:hypothetical protein
MPSLGSILLRDVAQHLASVDIACNFCPRVGKAHIGRLMSEHGPDMPIPTLLRLLSADYPRRAAARIAEPCGVHLPGLADVFGPTCGGRHHDRHQPRTHPPQAPQTRAAGRDHHATYRAGLGPLRATARRYRAGRSYRFRSERGVQPRRQPRRHRILGPHRAGGLRASIGHACKGSCSVVDPLSHRSPTRARPLDFVVCSGSSRGRTPRDHSSPVSMMRARD